MIPTLVDGIILPDRKGGVLLRFVRVYDVKRTSIGRFGAWTHFEITGWLADFKVTDNKPDEFIDLGLEEPLATSKIISFWLGGGDTVNIEAKTMSLEDEIVAKALGEFK